LLYLMDALVSAGKAGEIEAALATFENRQAPEQRAQMMPYLKSFMLYQTGKAQECAAYCAETPLLQQTPIRAQALLAAGKARQAADDPDLAKVWHDPWQALALSLAFSLAGQDDDAARWRERARHGFQLEAPAQYLNATAAPSVKDLARVHPRIFNKALFLAALAMQFPARRAEYLALAARLNVWRAPHYLLVRQALDRKAGPQ
jgi:hypothetical protein